MNLLFDKDEAISILPHNAKQINFDSESGELTWVMSADDEEDDNRSFTLGLNLKTGIAGWEGNDIISAGEYYKEIKTLDDFKQALIDWYGNYDTWNN